MWDRNEFFSTLANSPIGIAILNPETRVLFMNEKDEKLISDQGKRIFTDSVTTQSSHPARDTTTS